jgi:anti-sigma B factor antagonist
VPIFDNLEAVRSGTRIALPSIDLEFARRRTNWKGPDSVLSNNSKSVEKSGMKIAASEHGALASLYGRIDIDSSPAVRDQLIALLHAPHQGTVSIDLLGVTHIDISGVATLIEALKIARTCKTDLRLQGLHDRVRRLFEATGILSLFNEGILR